MIAKLILLSLMFAMIAIPVRAAKDPQPERGLRKALTQMSWFNLVYLLLLMFVYGRFAS